ncbi:hypothetical protein V8E36_001239 [Tilletia maclaganii]
MAAAFSSSQQDLLGRRLRSGAAAARGREAPMDFAYDHAAVASSSSSRGNNNTTSSPFLAALQSEARRRQQDSEAPSSQEHDADVSMTDQPAHNHDDEDNNGTGAIASASNSAAAHRLRQYPVGGFSGLSLHRKRSQSRKSALLGGGSDLRDTTMEDLAADHGRNSEAEEDFIDDDAHQDKQLVLPQSGSHPNNAGLATLHTGGTSTTTAAPPTINYFLAPFLPQAHSLQPSNQQLQPHSAHGHNSDHALALNQRHDPQRSHKQGWIGSNVHHMDWPELLLGHAQVVFNTSLLAATLYLLFLIARTIQRDVEWKWLEYRAELATQIAACRTSYERNHCASPSLGVDFQAQCALWARCMQRDPDGVGRARVFAETVADIANGFVDRVSWKTMAFTLLCLFIFVGGTNSTLSSYRHAYAARRYASNQSSRGGGGGGGGQGRDRRSNRSKRGQGQKQNNKQGQYQQAQSQRVGLQGRAGAIATE